LSVIGRILLSFIFVMSAVGNKIPNFSGVAEHMGSAGVPAPRVMLAGAIVFLLAGAASLVLGFRARVGASLLLVFLILATYYFHDFWTFASDSPEFQQQMGQFMKNTGLMGAMVLVIANGVGPMSLDAKAERGQGAARPLTEAE
jgi:putative oxidoreductase